MKARSFEVLGVAIDQLTLRSTVERISELVRAGNSGYVAFCTVSTVLSARDSREVSDALDSASLVTPDGMPLVWLGRRSVTGPLERVYGPDLMIEFFEVTGGEFSHFFYGGQDDVTKDLVNRLQSRFPEMRVAGTREPLVVDASVTSEDEASVISASGADIVWVGLGHPKQELWMRSHSALLPNSVLLGVGAAFDFHAGRLKEAPRWMRRSGLQWLHRLLQEPRRLWRRYILGNSRFLLLLVTERLRRRRKAR